MHLLQRSHSGVLAAHFVLIIALFGVLAAPLLALANDAQPNYNFSTPVVSCGQIADLKNIPGYVIVFDYDASTGNKLGRPWVVAAEGKCYTGGNFIPIPKDVADQMGDLLSNPAAYDSELDIIHRDRWDESCGLQSVLPSVCPILLNQIGVWGGHFGSPRFSISSVLGPSLENFEYRHFDVLYQYLPADYFYPDGNDHYSIWAMIHAIDHFKGKEITPRMNACDRRTREAEILHMKSNPTPKAEGRSISFEDFVAQTDVIWTMRDGSAIDVTEHIPRTGIHWGDGIGYEQVTEPRSVIIDNQKLWLFETMGCLDEVFQIRAEVVTRINPGINREEYVERLEREYREYLANPPALPQIDENEKGKDKSSSSNVIVLDDSMLEKLREAEAEKKAQQLYFRYLPVVGLVLLCVFVLYRIYRRHV